MKKILSTIIILTVLFTLSQPVKANILIGRKNFVGYWEKDDATAGNYTSLIANNSISNLGFSWDYYIVEKEEFISIDRMTTGEVCYLSIVWITNSSSTWVKGVSTHRIKADGNDLYTTFKTIPTDSRYICRDCCLANITINNDYSINDHILWVWVTSGTMNLAWSGISIIKYYLYSEGDSQQTSTISGDPFDPLDEAEELWRDLGPMLLGITIILVVAGAIIYLKRRIQ